MTLAEAMQLALWSGVALIAAVVVLGLILARGMWHIYHLWRGLELVVRHLEEAESGGAVTIRGRRHVRAEEGAE